MVVDPFNFRYLGARRGGENSEIYASVVIRADTNKNIRTQVTVVERDSPAFRMVAAGAGFLAPVAPNDSEDGRAKNRRVEMIPR